jgi:hypothetical protein
VIFSGGHTVQVVSQCSPQGSADFADLRKTPGSPLFSGVRWFLAFADFCGELRKKSQARSYPQFSANLPQALRPVVVGFPQFPQNPQGVAFGSVKTASRGNILRLSKRFYPSGGELRNNRSGFYETFVKVSARWF